LPCWATPECFFDHLLGTTFLTIKCLNMGQILLQWGSWGPPSQKRHVLLYSCYGLRVWRSAIPGPTRNPRLRVTQQHWAGPLIESTKVARATLCTNPGKDISLVARTSKRLSGCD
jgi:hypothetical protein